MFRITPLVATAAVALALALSLFIEHHQLQTQQARSASIALQSANLAAEHDSTRVMAGILADSLRLSEKQVRQIVQAKDSLDRALGRERLAKYDALAAVDSLHATALAPPGLDTLAGSRRADFALRREPYTITARAELPAPPDTARLDVRVTLDPIPVQVRLSCSKPDSNGIRAASIDASTPSWATLHFGALEQSPDLCASPALRSSSAGRHRFQLDRLVLGAGRLATSKGWAWGLFIGSGIVIWG